MKLSTPSRRPGTPTSGLSGERNTAGFWSGVVTTCITILMIKVLFPTKPTMMLMSPSLPVNGVYVQQGRGARANEAAASIQTYEREQSFDYVKTQQITVEQTRTVEVAIDHTERQTVNGKEVKLRQTITDWGYHWTGQPIEPFSVSDENTWNGWFDVQCQGVSNDFCRLVGSPIHFSCALAGDSSSYSPENKYDPQDFDTNRLHRDCPGAKPVQGLTPTAEKKKVVIVVPMTSRGLKIKAMENSPLVRIVTNSLERTLKDDRRKFDVHVYAGFDVGDAYWDPVKKPSQLSGFPVTFVKCPCKSMVCNTNCVMRQAYNEGAEYVFRGNDDTEFKGRDWLTPMVDELGKFNPPNIGVVGPSCKQGNTAIMTHDFTHRSHMAIFKMDYYPPILENYFCDDWISNVYGKSRTKQLKNVEVWHHVKMTRYEFNFTLSEELPALYATGTKLINAYIVSV